MVHQSEICARLGVDAYGLERLIQIDQLPVCGPVGAREIEAEKLDHYERERTRTRDAALKALAALDGPHV